MKKEKKDKKKKLDLFTKTKRIKKDKKKTKTTRLPKKITSPFKITVRDWGASIDTHKEIELNEDSKLEISIDKNIYVVSINKKNRCLQFDTHETHLYIQPTSVHSFLVKANSSKKEK